MASTVFFRNGIFIGLFVLAQFFWLFATFAYSETGREERGVYDDRAAVGAIAAHAIPSQPDSPRSPHAPSFSVGNPNDPSAPSAAAQPSTPGPDLGSRIKYCIVFPILNSAGEPIPAFDVPPCEGGPSPVGSPRLTIVKIVINDDDGSATTTDFTLLVGSTTVRSGVQRTYSPGTYVVSEATTTVTIGSATMRYVPDFSGDCDSSGAVSLAAGDTKTCTITNDDEGPGGQGGEGDGGGGNGGGDGGNGGGGNGGGDGGGGGGGSALYPGSVLAAAAPSPEFVGGYTPEPGPPNAGGGGQLPEILGILIFSGASTLLAGFLSCVLGRRHTVSSSALHATIGKRE